MSQEPRIKRGIQFIQTDQINGELRVIGEDDAACLLWAGQWLDEHREYIITAIQSAKNYHQYQEAEQESARIRPIVFDVGEGDI